MSVLNGLQTNDPGGFGLASRSGQLQGILASLNRGMNYQMEEGKEDQGQFQKNQELQQKDNEFAFNKQVQQQQLDALKSYRAMQITDTQRRLGDIEQKNEDLTRQRDEGLINNKQYRDTLNGIRQSHIDEMAKAAKDNLGLKTAHEKTAADLNQAKFDEKSANDANNFLLNSDKFENTKQAQTWKQAFDLYGQRQGELWKTKNFAERQKEFEASQDGKKIQQSMDAEKQANVEKQQGIDNTRKAGAENWKRQQVEDKKDTRTDDDVENQAALNAEKDAQSYEKNHPFSDPSVRSTWVDKQHTLWASKLRADAKQKGSPVPEAINAPAPTPNVLPQTPETPSILPEQPDENDVNSGGAP